MTIRRGKESIEQRAQRAMRDVFPGSLGGVTPVADPFAPAVVPLGANPVGVAKNKPSTGGLNGVYASRWTATGTIRAGSPSVFLSITGPDFETGDTSLAPTMGADGLDFPGGTPQMWLFQLLWTTEVFTSDDYVRASMNVSGGSDCGVVVVDKRVQWKTSATFVALLKDETVVAQGVAGDSNTADHDLQAIISMICLGPASLYTPTVFTPTFVRGFFGTGI